MWIIFGFASALLLGIYDLFKKSALRGNAVLPVLFWATCFAGLPFVFLLLFSVSGHGEPLEALGAHSHGLLWLKSLIVSGSWTCAYFALKHLPISLGAPIRSTQPLFTVAGAILLFGERMSIQQWAGAAALLISYFMLSSAGRKEGVDFKVNKWVFLMIGATLLGAVSSLLDKHLLRHLPALEVQVWYSIYMIVVIGVVVLVAWMPGKARHTPFSWKWSIPCIGLTLAAADFLYFRALAEQESLISVLTLVRRSGMLVSFFAGSLIFREGNFRAKLPGVLGIVAGLALLCLR